MSDTATETPVKTRAKKGERAAETGQKAVQMNTTTADKATEIAKRCEDKVHFVYDAALADFEALSPDEQVDKVIAARKRSAARKAAVSQPQN